MTLKVKLQQIVDAMPSMAVFANAIAAQPEEKDQEKWRLWRATTAKEKYSVGKLVKKMHAEFSDYQETHADTVKKYGEKKNVKGKDGEPQEQWRVKDEHEDTFRKEIDDLLDKELEIDGVVVMPWSYVEKVNPTPAVMSDLFDFMEAPPA